MARGFVGHKPVPRVDIPDKITALPVIPHNRTGKKLELPVKKILLGAAPDEVASRDVLADPTALDAFVALRGGR